MKRYISEALQSKVDVIVAAGGDGSINQASGMQCQSWSSCSSEPLPAEEAYQNKAYAIASHSRVSSLQTLSLV